MQVPIWIWVVSVAVTAGLVAFDFFAHARTPHAPSFKESTLWTVFYVVLAIAFGIGMMLIWSTDHGIEFFAGYVTEKSLSVDNLFVFLVIMSSFKVPREYQQRVLLVGVVIALLLRFIFILIGAALIENFSWAFYLFGLFLVFTAVQLAIGKHDPHAAYRPNVIVRIAQKMLPVTHHYHGTQLTTRINGKRHATPTLMVMIAIGMTDILFALDSIPAIYGLTEVPYIVFAANAFALLGLIQLYFLLGGLLDRLVYLAFGLALVLGFIGIKLIMEALASNRLSFINGGEPMHGVPHVSTWLSLSIIGGILAVTTLASLVKSRGLRGDAHT